MLKFISSCIFILLCYSQSSIAQFIPMFDFAIAGGPIAGYHQTKIEDLNAELIKAGFPELPKGNFTLGGQGFIDLAIPKKGFLRISGFGIGFTTKRDKQINDTLTKAVTYGLGMGGLAVDYVKNFGRFDITCGSQFSIGSLSLDLYQYNQNSGDWNHIFNTFGSNSNTGNITKNFRVLIFGVQPQVGFGILLKKYLYLKANFGYMFGFNNKWKVDNGIETVNVPEGIKPSGFNFNLGINLGIFFRDE